MPNLNIDKFKTSERDNYILRSISKIRNKRWEYYIITRIIHRLDDLEIEFTCQQYVQKKDTRYYLTDMYFPQFGIHLEIDESHHVVEENKDNDTIRTHEIINTTNHKIECIKAFIEIDESQAKTRKLEDINKDVDEFISKLKKAKEQLINANKFKPWNHDNKYNPEIYRGVNSIDIKDGVVFKYQKDALSLFGYDGKHYQRGAWKLKSNPKQMVWFPRLYKHPGWENNLCDNGKIIIEKPLGGNNKKKRKELDKWESRIVFARERDSLGTTNYRFIGVFKKDEDESNANEHIFKLENTSVLLVKTSSATKEN